ncbi:glycosyltransferase family 4 protein [Gaetbulibacter sp. M240]|uniref:glycosyltransferase n=1 Tax=Gaetbulibacter sp. M240 TaxID=3126511 RepID=UPI00374F7DDB
MNRTLLIIGFVWPEPKSSAAGSRMMQLIHFFKEEGYQITFASSSTRTDRSFQLEKLDVVPKTIELNKPSFDEFIKTLQPDVVLFDRFMTEEQFGWRVAENCPDAIRILDTEDLHGLRKARELAFRSGNSWNSSFLLNEVAKREIASIYRSDLSLIISESEMELLQTYFKVDQNLLFYLPFMLEAITEVQIKALPKFNQREHFITIGNFLHEPNYQGVLFLKKKIWPIINAALPEAQLHIYGAYSSQKVSQLHNEKQGFLIKGFANDALDVMKQARICLAPLPFGAGLKGKIVDALQAGTPCIMNSIAAEGIFGPLEPNGCVVDNPEQFAKKAIQLYSDASVWEEKHRFGFEILNERFNKVKFYDLFSTKLEDICQNLGQNREQNFTGQMLQHHQLQSTKYLSKWIEEKNRPS